MDIKEVLKLADDLVFAHTGKHLDDLQQAVLRGVWQGQKYAKIAEESHCTEGYVRNVASGLWQILSGGLGENVNRANLRSTLERWQFSKFSSAIGKAFVGIGNINVCGDTSHSPEVRQQRTPASPTPSESSAKPKNRQDLRDAPAPSPFYGRTGELSALQKWIVQERCRLVALLGITGTGKSALALQLVNQIQDKFECVIWRTLRYSPPLEPLEKSLIQFLSGGGETEFPPSAGERHSLLLESLRSHRSLIILDDAQMLLSSGQLAGNYRPDCEDYSTLFRLAGEFPHNSCLVLLSWEPPKDITALRGESAPVRTLHLDGLGAASAELLREKGLRDEEKWPDLIDTYRGNPLWLNQVATLIQELFRGGVAEFLKYDNVFLGEELAALLHRHFHRLSELEKAVISRLANQGEPVTVSQLLEDTQLSPSEVFSAVQSLSRRSLIEKQEQGNETLFTLSPAIEQYVKNI
jgi:hypothetical protein